MGGLAWVMETKWSLVIILRIPQKKTKKKKTLNKIHENKEGEPRNKNHSTKYAVSLH